MALIKCLECGKEISDKADKCPSCGCPVETQKSEREKKNKSNKKAKKSFLLTVTFSIIILAIIIIYVLKAFNNNNIIIGEWEISGLSRGDRHFTIDQLEALEIQVQGNASFDEKRFVFSLENLETVGTWREVEHDKNDDMYYYELTSDSGDATIAIIDKETNWLYITIPDDEDSMIVYEKR